jgi:hypothetical protein
MMRCFLLLLSFVFSCYCIAQNNPDSTSLIRSRQTPDFRKFDSLAAREVKLPDTAKKKMTGPRRAAIRSAILPGWGQATNKKYWKIPIVYGALGITAYAFNFNITQYNRVGYAYRVLVNSQRPNGDTSLFHTVDADLKPFLKAGASNDLRNYRNTYRKDIDYSVLIFLFFWGLNVVDATVDAHLKGFDVTDDLSMKIKPGFSPLTKNLGLSLVFDIHKGRAKSLHQAW